MGETLRLHVVNEFVIEECYLCGVAFAMTAHFESQARRLHTVFHCPNGHRQSYEGKTEEERLREQLARKEQELTLARRQRDGEQNRSRALRGHLTRHKRRSAAGLCPCCRRTFAQLARHMKSKHPDFAKDGTR